MPGGAPGLQNQCGVDKVPGGFDSHSPPPFIDIAAFWADYEPGQFEKE